MTKESDTGRYTADEIAAMVAQREDKTYWARVRAKTEDDLAADTASDPAFNGIDESWVRDAEVMTDPLARRDESTRQVTMHLDADVLDFFDQGGQAWQGRVNAILRGFMEQRRSLGRVAPTPTTERITE